MSSQHLNGIGGRENVTDFYNRVVYPLGLTAEKEFFWREQVHKAADGSDVWTTTLSVLSSEGALVQYTGQSSKKGLSKDAAAYQYLLIHGFIVPSPLGS